MLLITSNKIKDIGDKILGESNQWSIDLQGIYFLIPLRRTRTEIIEYRKFFELYDSIFSDRPISYKYLISQFVELAQVYKFRKFKSYNIGEQNSDIGLTFSMLKANLFLLYLKSLNLLKGGENMDYNSLQLNEQMKDFLKKMGYDEPKVSMFLLGYLIGEIGNAQYLKGDRSKSILGKITFQGINKSKLIRLVNEVFGKLIEYKKLTFNEQIFAECKRLIDQHIILWTLKDQENVFYILSGYAYATYQALSADQ